MLTILWISPELAWDEMLKMAERKLEPLLDISMYYLLKKNMLLNQVLIHKKIFSKNFVTIHEIKSVLALNIPIYLGFSILENHFFLTIAEHIIRKLNQKTRS